VGGWKVVLACVLAFDIIGGIAANASAAAQRWYHRPGSAAGASRVRGAPRRPDRGRRLGLPRWRLGYVAAGMVWLLGAVAVLLWAPLYLRRTLALCAVLAASCSSTWRAPDARLEWFAAAFYLKLLAAHANREAPFAPAGAS
jgi:hypothetical protein